MRREDFAQQNARIIQGFAAKIFINQLKELARAKNNHVQNKGRELPVTFSAVDSIPVVYFPLVVTTRSCLNGLAIFLQLYEDPRFSERRERERAQPY